jgi:hypothetical protein
MSSIFVNCIQTHQNHLGNYESRVSVKFSVFLSDQETNKFNVTDNGIQEFPLTIYFVIGNRAFRKRAETTGFMITYKIGKRL